MGETLPPRNMSPFCPDCVVVWAERMLEQVLGVSGSTHQDGGRLDDLDGFGQRGRHGRQLVAYLLRGHVLQEGPDGGVLFGGVVQVRAEAQRPRGVVDTDLRGEEKRGVSKPCGFLRSRVTSAARGLTCRSQCRAASTMERSSWKASTKGTREASRVNSMLW